MNNLPPFHIFQMSPPLYRPSSGHCFRETAWVYWRYDPARNVWFWSLRSVVGGGGGGWCTFSRQQLELQKLSAEQPLPGQAAWTVHHSTNHTCQATLLKLSWTGRPNGPVLYDHRLLWSLASALWLQPQRIEARNTEVICFRCQYKGDWFTMYVVCVLHNAQHTTVELLRVMIDIEGRLS